jgi:hypothetical protein
MDKGELTRDACRWLRRQAPVLLPGFAGLWVLVASDTYVEHVNLVRFDSSFGGFLILLLLVVPASAVVGLVVQAIRISVFDCLFGYLHEEEPDPDSPHALHYGVFANLAVVWPAIYVVRLIDFWEAPWDRGSHWGALLLCVLVEAALVWAALLAYRKAAEPKPEPPPAKPRTRKKTPKKTTS